MKNNKKDIANPFDTRINITERSAVSILSGWMREIIEKQNLNLGLPNVDTTGSDSKSPDLVINESQRSKTALCVIEAKLPYFDVFNEEELREPARKKANRRKAKYFATTNFKKLIWWKTKESNDSTIQEEFQIVDKYNLSQIEDLNDIENFRYSHPIKNELESFLIKLHTVATGKDVEPKQAIDELLIFRLHEKIRVLSSYYKGIIEGHYRSDPHFARNLRKWFKDQSWEFVNQPIYFEKAARQTAYLLINKILFYDLLQAKRPKDLDPLEIPHSLTKGAMLKSTLENYFEQILKIDYQTIYSADFIDSIAFPNNIEVVKEIKDFVNVLQKYDFSKLGYDILGRIFERLIPQDERHILGQYFTNSDIVDLILKFCITHESDVVIDPACGAGTFLVRAYQHKKMMNARLQHEKILDSLWGVDIARFPAHLATINLAIKDLGVDKNYPNIIHQDFFEIMSNPEGGFKLPENWRKLRAKVLGLETREVTFPTYFDSIVGNPPYTKNEEISEIDVDKDKLINNALNDLSHKKRIANISKRAGIHTYFFVHGSKFLREGGYFGFIVSNSWLDADYGKGLQEFFLSNFKIIAIIESKVERWFEEADINTCIIILQKCSNNIERNNNLIRFVYLKKPLRQFIPLAQDTWEKQLERINAIDNLIKTILTHNELYENDDMRIFPQLQNQLWNDGYDYENENYEGSKWGKYIKAPEIYFRIISNKHNALVPLFRFADVRRGITSGANEFFFISNREIESSKIETKYWKHRELKGKIVPNYIIKSPRDYKSIYLKRETINDYVIITHDDKDKLKYTHLFQYIKKGERNGFNKRPTCSSRKIWYDLGPRRPAQIFWPEFFFDSHRTYYCDNFIYDSDKFYGIIPFINYKLLSAYLNSTVAILLRQIGGFQGLGEGALKMPVYEVKNLPCIDFELLSDTQKSNIEKALIDLSSRDIESVFKELGAIDADSVSFNKIKPDRRELDRIIMGEILGLTEEEQLSVYRAVIDLIKSRLAKAKSVNKKPRLKEGIDINAFVNSMLEKIGPITLGSFYRDNILNNDNLITKQLPKYIQPISIEKGLFSWKLIFGKKSLDCRSENEARYIRVFIECGFESVKVPINDIILAKVIDDLEKIKYSHTSIINSELDSIINKKTRESLTNLIWSELLK